MGAWGSAASPSRKARWALVLLALAVAIPAATLGRGGEGGPIPEKSTSCWPCHVSWPDPLKTFYTVLPPPEAGAAVGEEFDFTVQLQNPWLHEIIFVEPALDLTNAPSLQFSGGPEPITDLVLEDVVTLRPQVPPTDPARPWAGSSGFVAAEIPIGVTYVSVLLSPLDTNEQTGPRFGMNIYTGTTEPAGNPARTIAPAGNGRPVELILPTAGEVGTLGTGNWTIEATVADAGDVGVPRGGTLPFAVTINARAETSDVTVLVQPQNTDIQKRSSFLFTYGLKAVKEPAPGETVAVAVNGTMFYEHDDKGTDSHANVTKAFEQPIAVQLAPDGRVILVGPTDAGFVVVQPKNGASIDTLAEAVGYASAFLLVSSIWTGGMFGKASRRQLNGVFGSAKRRVAFHNFLSYGILLLAVIHTVLFIVETAYYWTLGLIWGGLAILAMVGLGVTGAWQVAMIRRWNYAFWRWSHYGLAVAAILFTVVHGFFDGVHFGFFQDAIGWDDPLDPRSVTK